MDNRTLILILLQIAVIIGLARLVGSLFSRINQPPVIGEIVAGIMLGPSFLGALFPAQFAALFPAATLPFLYLLAQIGLIFFMFLVGLELNPKYLRDHIRTAIITSNVSILLPFALGAALAFTVLYAVNDSPGVSLLAFTLFVGAAMSITAFPVLARIITERNLQNTPLGTLALTCASIDDISAWLLLAAAIAVTRTDSLEAAVPTLIYLAIFIFLMVTVGRKLLKRIARDYSQARDLPQWRLTLILIAVLLSAIVTEGIGIDVIFGGFLLGVIMPKDTGLSEILTAKTEDFVSAFLLPIFFAYSGLNTHFGLLNTPWLWGVCALVIGAAIIGKYAGVNIAARGCGVPGPDAGALGWLMNTRGLTELIVLNIGLKLKVISPVVFSIFVLMALVTTIMTSPLLARVYPLRGRGR